MPPKTAQLQIRVTPEQKRTLKRLAREADMDVSAWVLARALPAEADRFEALVNRLAEGADRRFALAELADWLKRLPPDAFRRAVAHRPRASLDIGTLNYLAGAIELAAARRAVTPPSWTADVPVPATPLFGSTLAKLRPYLLARSPVVLRRRNIFVDASFDERV